MQEKHTHKHKGPFIFSSWSIKHQTQVIIKQIKIEDLFICWNKKN